MPPLVVGASKNCLCFAVRLSSHLLLGSFGPWLVVGAFTGAAAAIPTRAAAMVTVAATTIDAIIMEVRAIARVVLVNIGRCSLFVRQFSQACQFTTARTSRYSDCTRVVPSV